jgi:hypothetical protein
MLCSKQCIPPCSVEHIASSEDVASNTQALHEAMAEVAAQIRAKYGLSLRPDWVQACLNHLQGRSAGAGQQDAVLAQALLADLNACGAGNLPADLKVCAAS